MANQQPHRRFKRETMSSRWMPGQKLAIVRKSDRLKSEGDFEGERQLEEWSPADRQGNVYKKDNLVMEGELHSSRKEFETKAEYMNIF